MFEKKVSYVFKFVTDDIMEDASGGSHDLGIEMANREELCDLDYGDNLLQMCRKCVTSLRETRES